VGCGGFPLWGFYLLWFVGFFFVFFLLWVFLDLACIYTEFFVAVLVVGFFHCRGYIYYGLCGLLFLLWGFFIHN
jgi:hypothetical protein